MANSKSRVIALVDMDCFYVQVEEKYDPSIKGVPAAVVQYKAFKGGGIIAVNYEARARGIGRNMRGDDAKAACPEIILVHVPEVNGKADLTKYRDAGKEVLDVLCEFSSNVERASVDEAYIDLTEAVNNFIANHSKNGEEPVSCLSTIDKSFLEFNFPLGFDNSNTWLESLQSSEMVPIDDVRLALGAEIVGRMRQAVYEKTGYRCSAGIAHNKVLAKLGAGLNKPNKQTVITHESVPLLYAQTKVTKVRMLGGQFGELLVGTLKCENMSDLLKYSMKHLQQCFGDERGDWLYNLARGYDNEPVTKRQLPQSIGCSKNFPGREALATREKANFWIHRLCIEVVERIQRDWEMNNRRAKLLTLHVTFNGHKAFSRSCGKNVPYNADKMSSSVMITMDKLYKQYGVNPINQLGLIASKLEEEISKNTKIDSFYRVKPPPSTTVPSVPTTSSTTVSEMPITDKLAEIVPDNNEDDLFEKSFIEENEEPIILEEKNNEEDDDSDIELIGEVSVDGDSNDKWDIRKELRGLDNEESTPKKVEDKNEDLKSTEKRKPLFVCSKSPPKRKLILPQNNNHVDISKKILPPPLPKIVPDSDNILPITSVSTNKSVSGKFCEDNAVPCCSKSLTEESENSDTKISDNKSENKSIIVDGADTKTLAKEYLQMCTRCEEQIPLWDYLSHVDFHVAQDLQDEFNKNSGDSLPTNNNNDVNVKSANPGEKNSTGMGNKRASAASVGKSRGGSSKRGRSTKPSIPTKPQMKTLDSYFLPKY